MDNKELEKLYTELIKKRDIIQNNERYIIGENPSILDKKKAKNPDNRIPTPLAKSAVEDMAGYAGRAGDIKTTYKQVEIKEEVTKEIDPFIDYMDKMDIYNKVDLENAELYEESLGQGESYELWWISEKKQLSDALLTAEYKIVPNKEIALNFSADLKQELQSAVHFTAQEGQHTADVYYPFYSEKWIKIDGGDGWKMTEDENKYPFSTVPLNIFRSNRRSLPYFQAEKSLIDAHDEVLSKALNEVDRFNAMIMLFGKKVTDALASKLSDGNVSILDQLGEGEEKWPEYLQKEFGGVKEFYSDLMDRFERLFHKSIKDPDMTSEAFAGGDQSGIAIAFKLMGMEFKASQIETYFFQGLERRLELYGDLYNASTATIDITEYKAVITANRNIPVDLKAKAEIAQMLTGIVTRETLLKFLPESIIKDAEEELLLIKKEEPVSTVNFNEAE